MPTQNAIAAKKYYDSKREIIAQRRKERRQLLKQSATTETANLIQGEIRALRDELNEVKIKCETERRIENTPTLATKSYEPTLAGILELFKDYIDPATKKPISKTHVDSIKTLFRKLNITNLAQLNNATERIEEIKNCGKGSS